MARTITSVLLVAVFIVLIWIVLSMYMPWPSR